MLEADAFIESPGTEAVIASESSGVDGHCVLPEVTFIFLLLGDKAEDWRDDSVIIGVVFLYHFSTLIPMSGTSPRADGSRVGIPAVLGSALPVAPGLVVLNLRSLHWLQCSLPFLIKIGNYQKNKDAHTHFFLSLALV